MTEEVQITIKAPSFLESVFLFLSDLRLIAFRIGQFGRSFKSKVRVALESANQLISDRPPVPAVDFYEHNNDYEIILEVPKLNAADVSLTAVNGRLLIKGETQSSAKAEIIRGCGSDKHFSSLNRTFYIPGNVDLDKINAKMKDGLLIVSLPKAEVANHSKQTIFSNIFGTTLKATVCISVVITIVIGYYSAFALLGDGSWYLLQILKNKSFFDWFPARDYAMIFTQIPVVLAIKTGLIDRSILIRLHTLGVQGIPLLFWLAALLVQFRSKVFWIFVLAFSVSYLSSGFCAIGEYNFAYAVTAFSAAILIKSGEINKALAAALMVSAILLMRAYESTVFLGPLLALLSILRVFKGHEKLFAKCCMIVSAALFGTGSIIALSSIIVPLNPQNAANAANVWPILKTDRFQYVLMMSVLAIFWASVRSRTIKTALVCGAAWLAFRFLSNTSFWATQSYEFRVISAILLFLTLLVAAFTQLYRKDQPVSLSQEVNLISLLFLISLMIPFFQHVFGFATWAKNFEYELNNRTGLTHIESTSIDSCGPYSWDWTIPSLSIVLRNSGRDTIILAPKSYKGWQPFDPKTIGSDIIGDYTKNVSLFQFSNTCPH